MIKSAIIGASGYIGSHLFRKYRLFFSDCIGTSFSRINKGLVYFDLRYPDLLKLNLEETEHKAVIITSAITDMLWCEAYPTESYAVNVQGTLNLIEQIGKTSLTTIFLSSDYVFNGQIGNYSDLEATHPITEYGRQKAEVEKEIPNLTNKYLILRLSKTYGLTLNDGTLLDSIASNLINKKQIPASTDHFFNPTSIDDVVSMLVYLQKQSENGIFNVCNPNSSSRYEIAYQLSKFLNAPHSLIKKVPLHSLPGMDKRPLNISLCCSPIFDHIKNSFLSINEAAQIVAANWLLYSRLKNCSHTAIE
ncbi:MAG TPA: sugar nucleotide-binding protein [Gammaproteobacteria bacterium]|nr:sugar nucleotide-binding protein [Gammaproteobacteria bacterium]